MNKTLWSLWAAAVLISWACGARPESHEDHHVEERKEGHRGEGRIHLTHAQRERMRIEVSEVKARDFLPRIELPGTVAFDENRVSYVSSPVEGKVDRVLMDYGSRVERGTVLAWIESPPLGQAQAEFLSAWASQKAEEPAYERAKALVAENAISIREFQEREARYLSTHGDYLKARVTLRALGMTEGEIDRLSESRKVSARLPLRSAVEGEVIERAAVPGQVVGPQNRLFIVADLSNVWVFVDLYEKDVARIRSGQKIFLHAPAYPHEQFEGVLDFVGQKLEESTRTARSRALVPNKAQKLKPGMFVTVTVPIESEETAEALVVPPSALIRVGDEEVTFVEVDEGEFEPRHLETGKRFENWVEVLKGVREGERVATKGAFTLKSEWLKDTLSGHDD